MAGNLSGQGPSLFSVLVTSCMSCLIDWKRGPPAVGVSDVYVHRGSGPANRSAGVCHCKINLITSRMDEKTHTAGSRAEYYMNNNDVAGHLSPNARLIFHVSVKE